VLCILLSLSTPSGAQDRQQPVPKTNEGILALRSYQKERRQLLGIDPKRTEKEVLELTLKQARLREEQSIRKGEFVRVGVFRYPAQLEELRWRRTRDVIQRVVPGMDEDPVYLEMLARQAASIEVVLRQEHISSPNPKASALLDCVLLGTIPDLSWQAGKVAAGDYSLVVLSNGFISFLYQAAKSVVLSWRPIKAKPGSTYSLSTRPEDIEYVLSRNPDAQEMLYKTLYDWLFKGYPRAVGYDPPPSQYVPALEVLINHSERFVIAHEYGHALLDKLASIEALPRDHASWPKEYRADKFAFFFEVTSASQLDQLPPNVALQGGLFVLSVLDVLRKALDIVRCGDVRKDEGSKSHPPTQERIKFLKELYRQQVGIDLKYNVPIEGELGQSKAIDLGIEGALIPGNTLNLLWDRIQHRFLEARQKGIKLHRIWGKTSCD
jgi:hypothetical protein